jgi:siroheme synthase (precorrin-2 oxidase/ferrochelatase)
LRKEKEMGTQIETMQEHEAIELFHQMCGKFGWVGCIFTEEDIRMCLEDDVFDEAEMDKMVEKVKRTRWWRKVMDGAMNQAGSDALLEAIREAKTGETE